MAILLNIFSNKVCYKNKLRNKWQSYNFFSQMLLKSVNKEVALQNIE